jgi:hypothetical protein
MKHGIWIQTSGKVEDVEINGLEDMQKCVGGLIEALSIDEMKHSVSVYINEEGLINELPINMPACLWLLRNDKWPAFTNPIHGDVLVMGCIDDEGETLSVPENVRKEIPNMLKEPRFEVYSLNEDYTDGP